MPVAQGRRVVAPVRPVAPQVAPSMGRGPVVPSQWGRTPAAMRLLPGRAAAFDARGRLVAGGGQPFAPAADRVGGQTGPTPQQPSIGPDSSPSSVLQPSSVSASAPASLVLPPSPSVVPPSSDGDGGRGGSSGGGGGGGDGSQPEAASSAAPKKMGMGGLLLVGGAVAGLLLLFGRGGRRDTMEAT